MSHNCRCAEEIDLRNENLNYLLTKEKLLKKTYHQLLTENLQKDIIIQSLKKKITLKKYNKFVGEISENCAKNLEEIGDSKTEDAAFVRTIINDLYSQEQLKKKTVSGRSKDATKTAISPETKSLLEKLVNVRLDKVKEEEEREIRSKNCLSRLIRNTINTAERKKQQPE